MNCYLPEHLDVFVKEGVAYEMSTIPNTATTPKTFYELRTGHRFHNTLTMPIFILVQCVMSKKVNHLVFVNPYFVNNVSK